MPIYEYRCSACAREFEYQQRMSDPDRVRCEACGTDTLERLISWTSVRSTGWDGALYTSNPREALKGTACVDRSRSQRFAGGEQPDAAETVDAVDAAQAPGTDTGASAPAEIAGTEPAGE